MSYEVPPCPACYVRNIVCVTCKSDKPKKPHGTWVGSWWYCGAECAKTEKPHGEMCAPHRAAKENLRASHPFLFDPS